MNHYEDCLEKLKKLRDWYTDNKGHRNEATTRLHLIDFLIFECLGWSREDVRSEERYENSYSDYSFYLPRRILIVEAKKEEEYFELPISKRQTEYSLNSLRAGNTALDKAIRQVAEYC